MALSSRAEAVWTRGHPERRQHEDPRRQDTPKSKGWDLEDNQPHPALHLGFLELRSSEFEFGSSSPWVGG